MPTDGEKLLAVSSPLRLPSGEAGVSLLRCMPKDMKPGCPFATVTLAVPGSFVNAIAEVLGDLLHYRVNVIVVVAVLGGSILKPLLERFVPLEVGIHGVAQLVPRQDAVVEDEFLDSGQAVRCVANLRQDAAVDGVSSSSRRGLSQTVLNAGGEEKER